MDDFKALLVEELERLEDAEQQWDKALPEFTKLARDPELRSELDYAAKKTEGDQQRLERAFRMLNVSPAARASKGMRGLIDEALSAVHDANKLPDGASDAALIIGIQKIKHYEICTYGGARALAERLNTTEVARLLDETRRGEYDLDGRLTRLSASVSKAA